MHERADDAEFTETTSLAVRPESAPVAAWTPSFAVQVDEAIVRKKEKARFFREVMDENKHYGKIPGAGEKPALLKPGAEMLLSNMGLSTKFTDEEPPIVDLEGLPEHGGEMYVHYRRKCLVYRQTGPREDDRIRIAEASGSCSSREKKYRWRDSQRVCPECGKTAIIKGKAEYGGGYLCFKKKDGCGAKFAENDARILDQAAGQVANPEVADLENTILKMADKRALVAATLVATGCSDIFTQDIEDAHADEAPPVRRNAAPQAQAPPKQEDSAAARAYEAFEIAKRLDLVPDDKVLFRDWVKDAFPGQGWSAVLASLRARAQAQESFEDANEAFDAARSEAAPAASQAPEETEADRERMHKRVFALCREMGVDEDARHEMMRRLFARNSIKDLTNAQVADFIEHLEGKHTP
ncbi:MAG: hypothetical protein WCD38_11790 [Candidatus Tumulicola sp.]